MKTNNPSSLVFHICAAVAVAGAAAGCGVIVASSMGLVSHAETLALTLCAAFPIAAGLVGMLIHGDGA